MSADEDDLALYDEDGRPIHILKTTESICRNGPSRDEAREGPGEFMPLDRSVVKTGRGVCHNCRRMFYSAYGHATDDRASDDEDAVSEVLLTVNEGDAIVWGERSKPVPVARVEDRDADPGEWTRRLWLLGANDTPYRISIVRSTFDRTEWLYPYVERRADLEKHQPNGEWVRKGSVTDTAVADRDAHDVDIPPVPDPDADPDLEGREAEREADDGTSAHEVEQGDNSVDWASLAN